MRLTLRTLLAYLDDTLEPHEIKEIGQKVAESDAAQELVARIKQITRRRRLTTPPATGAGDKFDANTVAEYLDNELSTEQVAELEKTCLESDVHLAEVASCHQILTLVLGEPALVPPTARERMYGLVKGREAIPFRKAHVRAGANDEDRDGADPFLVGLSSSRGWMIWALPLAAALLIAALAVAVWQALPQDRIAVANNTKTNPPPTTGPEKAVEHANETPPVEPTPTPTPVEPTPSVEPTPPPDVRPNPPSKVRVSAGRYVVPAKAGPTILVNREANQLGWKRLANGGQVFTTDDLVSLPGYQSELDLGPNGGARLLLHGNVPEYSAHIKMDYLMESAVQLHQPEAGFDLDLTLDRGRIYLSNHKPEGAVKVRLRFAGEIWDLTLLEPETEIGVDLTKVYTRGIDYHNEEPLQEVVWYLIKGRAGVKIDYREFSNLPAPAFIQWDNKGPAPVPQPVLPTVLPIFTTVWNKTPPAGATKPEAEQIQLMRDALLSLSGLMSEKKAVDSALLEARQKDDAPTLQVLAIYSFGAVDAVDKLLDVLCNDDAETHASDRNAAILTLRRWLARDPENSDRLFDAKKDTGLLMKYEKRTSDAQDTLDFLHDFSEKDAARPATFDLLVQRLRSDQLAVRELAYWQLRHLSLGARSPLPRYNAGGDADQRNADADAWKALIGKDLPPTLKPSPPMPPGAPRG
jgi:hypothetical protein